MAYTMSEKALAARKKAGFKKGEVANPNGRGGFGDNPTNRFKPKSYHEEAIGGWTSEIRLCLVKLNEISFETFMYLCFKWEISGQAVVLTNRIQEEIDEMFSQVDCDVDHPTNLVDTCARTVLESKSDLKSFYKMMEHIEGRAMLRSESKNINATVSIDEVENLKRQLDASNAKVSELLSVSSESLPELEVIDAEVININEGEAKPLAIKTTEQEIIEEESI